MLTLRDLERDGLVTRTQYPTIPPGVDYELAALGLPGAAELPDDRRIAGGVRRPCGGEA
jgi:hypothetical protein